MNAVQQGSRGGRKKHPTKIASLILTAVALFAWIIFLIGWGVLYNHPAVQRKATINAAVFTPYWSFFAFGPLIIAISILRNGIPLYIKLPHYMTAILMALHIVLFILFCISGAAMLILSPVLLFVSNATALIILVCCGGLAALITESVSSCIGWCSSCCRRHSTSQNVVMVQALPMQQPMHMNAPPQAQAFQLDQSTVTMPWYPPVQFMPQFAVSTQQSQAMPQNSFMQNHQMLSPPPPTVMHPPQLVQPPHIMQSSQSIQQSQAKRQTGGLQSDIVVEPNPTYQMSIPVNNTMIQEEYEYLPVLPDVRDQPLMNTDRPPSYTDDYI